ncbi:MAG: DUF1533 domain-containing protein [Lachnospiraceae bacterium]|nr:DUF1533 domain-containing protein [Lachnospiraceae bacterium]
MKKLRLMLIAGVMSVMAASPAAAAEEEMLYGTMQIPYAEFYAEEGPAYEVDAVSSATSSKWFSETLATGGYSVKHEEDNGGDILGVVYPVSISKENLDLLGENNYGFTALEEKPAAYKQVTVEEGKASFSAVQGATTPLKATAVLTTNTRWGDYEIDVNAINNHDGTSDIGPIIGVLLTTSDGEVYAMRQLENIWMDELSWSSGVVTVEPHGNVMSSENYVSLMGKTITAITYITNDGYHVLETELYVPVKFVGGAEIESVPAKDGKAAITFTDVPDDFFPAFSVSNGLKVSGLTWENALAGSYTLTVRDIMGKYADLLATFILSTDELPAAYDAEKNALVAAEGFSEEQLAAYISNLASVTVNETKYAASGRGAVAIIDVDGVVDLEAASVQGRGANAVSTPIFGESGEYTLTVEATGYETPLTFTVTVK